MAHDNTFFDRLRDRPQLEPQAMFEGLRLPVGSESQAVSEALIMFEQFFDIKASQLRPDDSLTSFLDHGERNPLLLVFAQARVEDRVSELNYQLSRRRRSLGVPDLGRLPATVREYLVAWLGMLP